MNHISEDFKRRSWVSKKIKSRTEQKDLRELPLFGQQRLAYERKQEQAQQSLFSQDDNHGKAL